MLKFIIAAFLSTLATVAAFPAKVTAFNEREPDHKPYGDLNCQGQRLEVGQCAADLRYHHLGDRIHIDGLGTFVVADCGSAIKGYGRFDIYVDSLRECNNFGVKRLQAEDVTSAQPAATRQLGRVHRAHPASPPHSAKIVSEFTCQSSKPRALLAIRREEILVASL